MRTYKMTWNSKQARWFKKLDGRQYVVSVQTLNADFPHLVQSQTKEGSSCAANEWWTAKLATLTTHPQEAEINEGLETRRLLARWCELEGLDSLRVRIMEEADSLRAALKSRKPLRAGEEWTGVDGWSASPTITHHQQWWLDDVPVLPLHESRWLDEDRSVWADRRQQAALHEAWNDTKGLSLSKIIEMFLTDRAGASSPARVASLRLHLSHWRDWRGHDRLPVTGAELLSYKAHLIKQIEDKDKAAESARGEMRAVRFFTAWAYENEITDSEPRNLHSRSLTIPQGEGRKVVWTDEQISQCLAKIDGRNRLNVLLSLNCGMYASDIGQLRHDQVDWERGSVGWARSKTGKGNGLSYKLWDETMVLAAEIQKQTPHACLDDYRRNASMEFCAQGRGQGDEV